MLPREFLNEGFVFHYNLPFPRLEQEVTICEQMTLRSPDWFQMSSLSHIKIFFECTESSDVEFLFTSH